MPQDVPLEELFGFDPPGDHCLTELGWCEFAFLPQFEIKVLEDRGDYEVVQDVSGRKLLCFKNRRSGFMPEHLDHRVKDWKTWEEDVKWRLNPNDPERYEPLASRMQEAVRAAGEGRVIIQMVGGVYMLQRSIFGPTELLHAFHDQPALVHECVQAWFDLADAIAARHQQHVTFDQVFFGEDICYKSGPLISPTVIREFLSPYYRQLLENIKARQLDRDRHLFFHLDTDGHAPSVIPLYQELGLDVMSSFEVAAGCDVVAIGQQHSDLVMSGGIDNRVLATTPAEIDAYLQRVLLPMRARGGYVPTCDHGVPEEVSHANYRHHRRRCVEWGR